MPKGDPTYPTMTIDECLAFADEWSRGVTMYPGAQGWRVVCMLLAEEVREQRADLAEQCRLLGMGSEREARLMAQLAESQARELRMREALQDLSLYVAHNGDDWVQRHAMAALAVPSDDSALREMIEAAKHGPKTCRRPRPAGCFAVRSTESWTSFVSLCTPLDPLHRPPYRFSSE